MQRSATSAEVSDVPLITSLHADIVPHREMAVRRWFYHTPRWYYHRRGAAGEINTNRKFYQLIDPDLRDLCRMLHRARIHTTPSCQGHFHSRQHFETTWLQLTKQEQTIQSVGLLMRECESGREYLFQDSGYQLLWRDAAGFVDEAMKHQSEGYLGILLPRDRHALVCAMHDTPFQSERATIRFDGEFSCLLGGSLFGVTVKPNNAQDRSALWQAITAYLQSLIAADTTIAKSRVDASRCINKCSMSQQ